MWIRIFIHIVTFYTFFIFNNYLNLWPKNGSPKRQKAVLFTQQAGGDLKNREKHFSFSRKKNFLPQKSPKFGIFDWFCDRSSVEATKLWSVTFF